MGTACSTHGEDEKSITTSVGKFEAKSLLERHRHRWGYNIKMDLKGIVRGVESSGLR
jgi:hypothetical protein